MQNNIISSQMEKTLSMVQKALNLVETVDSWNWHSNDTPPLGEITMFIIYSIIRMNVKIKVTFISKGILNFVVYSMLLVGCPHHSV